MEKLLKMAQKVSDQAEVFWDSINSTKIVFSDSKLHDIESKINSGVALRIIKDNKLGFAYSRDINDRKTIIDNAIKSLNGKIEAEYQMPKQKKFDKINTYNPEIEEVDSSLMVDKGNDFCQNIQKVVSGEINIYMSKNVSRVKILNSNGLNVQSMSSEYGVMPQLVFSGGASGIGRIYRDKKFSDISENIVDEIADFYKKGKNVCSIKSGPMKVLFMPGSMHLLNRRLVSALNGINIYQKMSPLNERIGEKILNEKLTIFEYPNNDDYPNATSFDDEGVITKKRNFIENGVLKQFAYDLNYASKMKLETTANGYRAGITSTPSPSLPYLQFKPGKMRFREMIKKMDRGIILEGVLGAHSGNIPNGDYSIGVSPALYVEKGKIKGRIKDAMLAGNIYETLQDVVGVEDRAHLNYRNPAILCDNVVVSTK